MARYTETIEVGSDEVEMAEELSERGFARIRKLDATLGDARSFLSFQERIAWAESNGDLESIVELARTRMALYGASVAADGEKPIIL